MAAAEPLSAWARDASRDFLFAGHVWDRSSGVLRLDYRLDQQPLSERFCFPLPINGRIPSEPALERAFSLLHWVAGVSYWKAGCPQRVAFAGSAPNAEQADWLNVLYREGLAEFAWHNRLPPDRFAVFRGERSTAAAAGPAGLDDACLVPLGGGKDSLVAWSRLERRGLNLTSVQVGSSALIRAVAASAGGPHLVIERRLDPRLAELNAGGAWNGHVPITAINAAALVVLALLHGFGQVVFANERSADEATLFDEQGRPVNHQFAKSLAFERMLDHWVRSWIASDLRVFSLLRRDRELAICREFAGLGQFHAVFSSCNRNFHLDGPRTERWCGQCPKCHFVFLGLAPFMNRSDLARIFGADLLARPELLPGFRALLALDGRKPFECVGEAAEARAAIRALAEGSEWRAAPIVRTLNDELAGFEVPGLDELCRPGGQHLIPPSLLHAPG